MNVLALNPGSSSLRFKLVSVVPDEECSEHACLASGSVASIGPVAHARVGLGLEQRDVPNVRARDHGEAAAWVLDWLAEQAGAARLDNIDAVGVRVVHGGAQEGACILVTPSVEQQLEQLGSLAPLHNEGSLATIHEAARRLLDRPPIVAVFDTAFHADMPEVARTYALPHELTQRHGIRRFGFHGIAITSVLEGYAHRAKAHASDQRLVVLHLGSGASITAVRGGRGVDTSMGFSPLEGLVMATRSGDLDPSLVPYLARAERATPDEVVNWLNERSGLLGISGRSGDMREIERLRDVGDPRASLAFDLFAYRAKKHMAGMIAVLGGVDAVLFSGGIGENSAAARAAICTGMEWCGIAIDAPLNAQPRRSDGRISAADARVGIHVMAADEERIIARETYSLLASRTPSRTP
jgi:acetate kinase